MNVMKLKNLILAIAFVPAIGLAQTHKTSPLPLKTVEQAQLENKPVLLVQYNPNGSGYDALSTDRYIAQFLNKHFVIEKQTSRTKDSGYLIYDQQGKLVHRVADDKYP